MTAARQHAVHPAVALGSGGAPKAVSDSQRGRRRPHRCNVAADGPRRGGRAAPHLTGQRVPVHQRLGPHRRASAPDDDGWRKVLPRDDQRQPGHGPSRPTGTEARRLPANLRGRCLNCLAFSHRVATCRLPRRCIRCHEFWHLACDCKRPRIAAAACGTAREVGHHCIDRARRGLTGGVNRRQAPNLVIVPASVNLAAAEEMVCVDGDVGSGVMVGSIRCAYVSSSVAVVSSAAGQCVIQQLDSRRIWDPMELEFDVCNSMLSNGLPGGAPCCDVLAVGPSGFASSGAHGAMSHGHHVS